MPRRHVQAQPADGFIAAHPGLGLSLGQKSCSKRWIVQADECWVRGVDELAGLNIGSQSGGDLCEGKDGVGPATLDKSAESHMTLRRR